MAEESPRRKRRVAEAVEKGVEGVYDFLFRLVRTFWLVSWHRNACQMLVQDRHSDHARYVLPFTYAAVGIFLVSLVAEVAGHQILDWIWFDQEIPQRIVERLREGVSLVAIAAGSVPAFIYMLALSGVLAWTVHRRIGRSGRAMFVTCYAIGTQSIYLCLAAVFVSTAQLLPDGAAAPDVGAAVQIGLALLLLACLAGAVIVPVRFFLKSFRRLRRSKRRGLARLMAYILVSAVTIWALPFMAALPGLLAAELRPSDAPTLTIESDPVLYVDQGQPTLAVDVLIENKGSKLLGISSSDARATIRFGQEPLEREDAGTLTFEPIRLENEAGHAVSYTSAAESKLVWRRLILRPSPADVDQLVQPASRSPASCIQVRLGSGDYEVESVCVRRTIEDRRTSASAD